MRIAPTRACTRSVWAVAAVGSRRSCLCATPTPHPLRPRLTQPRSSRSRRCRCRRTAAIARHRPAIGRASCGPRAHVTAVTAVAVAARTCQPPARAPPRAAGWVACAGGAGKRLPLAGWSPDRLSSGACMCRRALVSRSARYAPLVPLRGSEAGPGVSGPCGRWYPAMLRPAGAQGMRVRSRGTRLYALERQWKSCEILRDCISGSRYIDEPSS